MRKGTVLYVYNNSTRQGRLGGGQLKSIGIDLHKVHSMPDAERKLCEYDLPLIQFESIYKHISSFCTFTKQEYNKTVIVILMKEANPAIERRLFECGVDDIAVGKQVLPVVLVPRIKKRIFNNRLFLPKTDKVMLKGGIIIDMERGEVRFNGFCRRLEGISKKLFRYLLENHHRVASREELVKSYIWDNMVCQPGRVEGGRKSWITARATDSISGGYKATWVTDNNDANVCINQGVQACKENPDKIQKPRNYGDWGQGNPV